MVRLAVPLSLLALATLSSCTTPPQTGGPSQAAPNIVTNVHLDTSSRELTKGTRVQLTEDKLIRKM